MLILNNVHLDGVDVDGVAVVYNAMNVVNTEKQQSTKCFLIIIDVK